MSDVAVLLDPARRTVVAHRGASDEAPENTLPAFQRALELRVDALEMDVQMTADGVAVVIHDPTLDRTTDGTGSVATRTFAQLQAVDAGARFTLDGRRFPFRGAGIRIPALAEVLRLAPSTPCILEVKARAAQHAVKRVLLETGAADRCLVAAFDPRALDALREPEFLLGAARPDVLRLWLGAPLGIAPRLRNYKALFIPTRYGAIPVTTEPLLGIAKRLGCPVHVWTVDDVSSARRLWERGVTGIITNVPAQMLELRERMQRE